MSANFAGVTFAEQKVTPSADAIIRRAILSDGILTGCDLSYSGSTLTMAAGYLMVCGRQIRHPAAQNWAVVDATSGYARLLLTIDLTRTSTKDAFDQVVDTIEYASSVDGFPDLIQADINDAGTKYQIVLCTVSLGTGGISGIVSQLGKSAGDGSGGGSGGSFGALNFSVVGGLTQPADPAENMIWVNTSTTVTGYTFSVDMPERPSEGLVWIQTGDASTVAFSVTEENPIYIYPISCKQYVSGAWVSKTAKSYQDGQWVDWITYLYNEGDECAALTGGWIALAKNINSNGNSAAVPTVTRGANSMVISQVNHSGGIVCASEKIDLTEYNTLNFEGTATPADTIDNWCMIGVWDTLGTYYTDGLAASLSLNAQTANDKESVDVSKLKGEYYVGFGIYGAGSKIAMKNMWRE